MSCGNLFIVTAPSGAGKSTLVNLLLAQDARLRLSISHTTRSPRQTEANGREYHFVSVPEFLALKERGDFLEWAQVHDNYYATSRRWIEEQISKGVDIMLEIDWQGAEQVRKIFPAAIGIFILPPSIEDLEHRLRSRGQDSEVVIKRRLDAAVGEMKHFTDFDFVIINKDLQTALADLQAIVRACRLSSSQQRDKLPSEISALSFSSA